MTPEEIAAVLETHGDWHPPHPTFDTLACLGGGWHCSCGERLGGTGVGITTAHRAHVAEVLAALMPEDGA